MATSYRFEIPASALHDLLRGASMFALTERAGGDIMPVLNAVYLQAEGRTLTATAATRFIAGRLTYTVPDESPPLGRWAALVPLAGVRAIRAALPAGRTAQRRTLTVTVYPETGGRVRVAAADGTTLTVPTLSGVYPPVGGIIDAACDPDRVGGAPGMVGLDASRLAVFARVPALHGEVMEVRMPDAAGENAEHGQTNSKAVGVTIGGHFEGAIMPKRRLT